jgi:hypothetical protein
MDPRREDGIALLFAIMAMLLMMALGVALVLTTSTETIIAANFRNSAEGLYAAEAALERAIADLLTVSDWNPLLGGLVRSAFVDGAPDGSRTLVDNSLLDLGQTTSLANCQKTTPCSDAAMDAVTPERPWGANNPRWQLYAYGPLGGITPAGTVSSSYYVVVMVGDDPSENDDNPLRDGVDGSNPGTGVLAVRAEAFGPRGAHKVIESTVARTDTGVRMLSWRAVQ